MSDPDPGDPEPTAPSTFVPRRQGWRRPVALILVLTLLLLATLGFCVVLITAV